MEGFAQSEDAVYVARSVFSLSLSTASIDAQRVIKTKLECFKRLGSTIQPHQVTITSSRNSLIKKCYNIIMLAIAPFFGLKNSALGQ